MTNKLPIKQESEILIFSDQRLNIFKSTTELKTCIEYVQEVVSSFIERFPFCRLYAEMPKVYSVFDNTDVEMKTPAIETYQVLSDILMMCGFSIAAICDIRVLSHGENTSTAIKITGTSKLVTVQ